MQVFPSSGRVLELSYTEYRTGKKKKYGRVYSCRHPVSGMKISCEMCGNEDWKMVIYEMSLGRVGGAVFSALKCECCGMVYPLQELAKGTGRHVSKETVIGMLKQ